MWIQRKVDLKDIRPQGVGVWGCVGGGWGWSHLEHGGGHALWIHALWERSRHLSGEGRKGGTIFYDPMDQLHGKCHCYMGAFDLLFEGKKERVNKWMDMRWNVTKDEKMYKKVGKKVSEKMC